MGIIEIGIIPLRDLLEYFHTFSASFRVHYDYGETFCFAALRKVSPVTFISIAKSPPPAPKSIVEV